MTGSIITRAERAEIDRRVAAGEVQRLPAGATSFVFPKWNGHKLALPDGTDYYRKKHTNEANTGKRRAGAVALPGYIIARREKVAALHADGLDTTRIVAALGDASASSVENDLRRLGLVPHPYIRPDRVDWPARHARISALAAEGKTYAEIAAEMGMSVDAISKTARLAGIKVRHASRRDKKVS